MFVKIARCFVWEPSFIGETPIPEAQ